MNDFAVFIPFTFQRRIDRRQVFDSKGCMHAVRPKVIPDVISSSCFGF